jgi:phosphoserine phosphatase
VDHGFQLCTLDLDGTLLRGTCFLAVSEALGKAAEVRRLDALYDRGEMPLRENFFAEFRLLEGMPVADAQAALRKGPWLARLPEGVAALRALGLRVGLLTDQPRFLAGVAEPTLDPVLCSEGGVRDGRIAEPVDYREDKAAGLRAWCRANEVDLAQVIHCGNGRNDVPVFERVGLAVAVNPDSQAVARRADLALEGVTDLRQVAEVVERALREGV